MGASGQPENVETAPAITLVPRTTATGEGKITDSPSGRRPVNNTEEDRARPAIDGTSTKNYERIVDQDNNSTVESGFLPAEETGAQDRAEVTEASMMNPFFTTSSTMKC